jgi:2-iminobutanoate/2-iminopropanoate deaminase
VVPVFHLFERLWPNKNGGGRFQFSGFLQLYSPANETAGNLGAHQRQGLKLGRRGFFPFHLLETNLPMPTKTIIKPAKSPAAVGPYNHAVRVGDLLFCAGQIPIEPSTGNLVTGDIKVQTERVLQNVKAILDDQNLTFANVVKSTVFLTSLADFAGMNEVYAKYFTTDFPARSTIQVAALPKAANVEIEVVAHF